MNDAKMERAMRLEKDLQAHLGNEYDVLSIYRKWLDTNGIPAETADGWPTEQAYERENIDSFIKDLQS